MQPAHVRAEQLSKRFDDRDVIKPLDLDIAPGTIVGLIGPSGSGKTTTVRLLAGLLAPTGGSSTVFGIPSTELSSGDRARIGYLPQTPTLFQDLSLHENLSFHASMYGLPLRRRERLDRLLDWVELTEHRSKRVSQASGGMQRRLALAAALVHDPDVAFLDEPTAGIDPILRDKMWDRFREAARRGTTIVVTTQYVGEAGQCDMVGLLSDGELLLLDTPENLRRAAFDGEVVDVVTERPVGRDELERLTAEPFVVGTVERAGPMTLRVVVDDADQAIPSVTDAMQRLGITIASIDEHIVDYDEAFVRVVQRHRSAEPGDGDELDSNSNAPRYEEVGP